MVGVKSLAALGGLLNLISLLMVKVMQSYLFFIIGNYLKSSPCNTLWKRGQFVSVFEPLQSEISLPEESAVEVSASNRDNTHALLWKCL